MPGVTSTLLVVLLQSEISLQEEHIVRFLIKFKKEAIVSEEDTGIVFEQDFFTKEEALENGNKVTEEICEEGMILLKTK